MKKFGVGISFLNPVNSTFELPDENLMRKQGVLSTFQVSKGGCSFLRENIRVVGSKESEYSMVNLSDLLQSLSVFLFFPSLNFIFESLELIKKVKHGRSRGSRGQPRGGYKIRKIIIKELSTIEIKWVHMTSQFEIPL